MLLVKNLLMPLFLMGCFPVDFQEVKQPLRTKSGKRPIKVGGGETAPYSKKAHEEVYGLEGQSLVRKPEPPQF